MKYATLAALLLTIFIAATAYNYAARPLTQDERDLVSKTWNPSPVHMTRGLATLMTPPPVVPAAAAVTIDTDLIAAAVAMLTAITLLFSLLCKYLIGPMIDKKLGEFRDTLDKTYVRIPQDLQTRHPRPSWADD